MAADCTLRGRVREAATGEDLLAGAAALFVHRVPADEEEEYACSMAGHDPLPRIETEGAAYLVHLPPGRCEILVNLPGRAATSRTVDLRAGETLEADVEVSPP